VTASTASWAQQRRIVADRLTTAGIASPDAEARWLTETASGYAGADWLTIAAQLPNERAQRHLDAMVERRLAGEPLQYVLGSWSFRGLDLMVDHRVLIPRPETEWVVEVALEEAARTGLRRATRPALGTHTKAVVADLGTGSGAIALALESELADVVVWATDASTDALAVAAANVAGCSATRVRLAEGSWFAALPAELEGTLSLIVANPPYIAAHELDGLAAEVAEHEPHGALVSGPTGLEAIEELLAQAPRWLAPGAALVLEIAPHQAERASDAARTAGFTDVRVLDDFTFRPRALVARRG
jgi:release factor glutamine methyltransferase